MSKWFEFTIVEDAWFQGTSVSLVVWYQQLRIGWKRTDDQGSHPAIAYHCPGDNISWWITKWPIYNDLITGLFAAATLSVYHQKWLVHRRENQAKVEDCLRSDNVVIQRKRKLMINVRTEENPWYPQFLGHTQLILCISLLGLHRVCTSRKSSGPSSNWTILTFSCFWSVVAAIVCMQWYSRNVPKSVVWTWIFVSFREYINFASHITSRVSYRQSQV